MKTEKDIRARVMDLRNRFPESIRTGAGAVARQVQALEWVLDDGLPPDVDRDATATRPRTAA